ncbi:MAG TPA: hypothetical protein VF471_07205 [Pseudoxanthomonas sp.]
MKWLRTVVLFDRGNIVQIPDWDRVHQSCVRAIERIDFPENSGSLTLRKKARVPGSKQWRRNGVGYLKTRFLKGMMADEGWKPEAQFGIEHLTLQPQLHTYPGMVPYKEPIASSFGGFDFLTETTSGLHVAIEWETGNISSSHRSVNKLAIALAAGKIHAGLLILPSRDTYEQLTDRIGNINELSPYLTLWNSLASTVKHGLLAISVVEHDKLTEDETFPYLPSGNDGRAKEGRDKLPPKKS